MGKIVFHPKESEFGYIIDERAYRNIQQLQRSSGFSFEETLLTLTDSELEKLGISVEITGDSIPEVSETSEILVPTLEPTEPTEPTGQTERKRKTRKVREPREERPVRTSRTVTVRLPDFGALFLWVVGMILWGLLFPFRPIIWLDRIATRFRKPFASAETSSAEFVRKLPSSKRGKISGRHSGKADKFLEGGKLSDEAVAMAQHSEGLERLINESSLWNTGIGLTFGSFVQTLADRGEPGIVYVGKNRDALNSYLLEYWGRDVDGIPFPSLWRAFLDEVVSEKRKAG
jgi:hypothetical protein